MGLLDFIAPALNTATQAAAAHETGRARGLEGQRENLLLGAQLRRQQRQEQIQEAIRQRQQQSMDLQDKIRETQLQQAQRELTLPPKPQAPVMGSPEWRDAIDFQERTEARYRPESGGSDSSWQVIQSDEGTFQVNPKTGQTRPLMMPGGTNQFKKPLPNQTKKAMVENSASKTQIDNALKALEQHEDAVGIGRGWIDALDQRLDPEGVDARALIGDIGSLKIHQRSGAAVTVSEAPRLRPFIPSATDSPETVRRKLTLLKKAIEDEGAAIEQVYNRSPQAPNQAPVNPGSAIKAKYGLE